MKIFTIGYNQKSAEEFFNLLKQPDLERVIDVRLHNVSQLAGFTKMKDLQYFLREIDALDYLHMVELAPSETIFVAYRRRGGDWGTFERAFLSLMRERQIEKTVDRSIMDGACLLCGEPGPEHCHRRLVAEYLRDEWGDVEIVHLQ